MKRPAFVPLQIKGACSLEAFCQRYNIRHEAMDRLIAHLFDIQSADNLPAWEQMGQLLRLMWARQQCLRFFHLPRTEAEWLLEQMKERMRMSGNEG